MGALLFLSHSILDGCDGELARLRFQESRWGGILDFWGDNVVHVAVFACMGIGWSLSLHETWPLWVGVLPVAGTIGSAWFAYRHTMQDANVTGPLFTSVVRSPDSRASHLIDALARRDLSISSSCSRLSVRPHGFWSWARSGLRSIFSSCFGLLTLNKVKGERYYE